MSQIAKFMGQHGAHLGPLGPRWDPRWPHEPCYLGCTHDHPHSQYHHWFWLPDDADDIQAPSPDHFERRHLVNKDDSKSPVYQTHVALQSLADVIKWKGFPHKWPFVWDTGGFPSWMTSKGIFSVPLDVGPRRLVNKQSSCRWFETPWRSCDVPVLTNDPADGARTFALVAKFIQVALVNFLHGTTQPQNVFIYAN